MSTYEEYRSYIYSGAWSALSGVAFYFASYPTSAPYQCVPLTILYMAITFHVAIDILCAEWENP